MNDTLNLRSEEIDRPPVEGKLPAFEVKPVRIVLTLDINLALALGDFLMDSKPKNKALWALGARLRDIVPPEKD